jgi:hypothetical protein
MMSIKLIFVLIYDRHESLDINNNGACSNLISDAELT